nr:glycosyltransferase family 1 protein [Ruminococcus flavefaciens]
MEYIVYTNEDMTEDMQFTNPNVTVKTYPVSKNSSMGNLLWNTFVFPLMVKKERADIALIPNFTLLLFKAAPTAIIMHDLIEFNIPEKFSKLRMFYRTKIADPITARRADSVITVSQNSKNDIIKFLGIGADKISVIFNGADRERFRRMDACRAREILTARGLPTEFILYTGTVDHPGKNSMTLIKAFESLKRSGRYDGSLIIAGMPGSGYDIVKDYADRSPFAADICFAGFVTDEELVALYSLCSAFVLVSLYEGFGIPPLEAISCGARVVVSNTSSLPEVVGELGLTVPPTDTEAVADAIYECTQHSADEDYLRAVDAHMKKFDWKDLSRQLESQLFRTMRKNGKRNG